MTKDKHGHLKLGGIPVKDLADKFGTPVYVYDADRIRQNYNRLSQALAQHFDDWQMFYAIKACNNPSVAQLLTNLGCGIDSASPNEIRLAQFLGVPPRKTMFTGNNLSEEDLKAASEAGVIINLDDVRYLPRLLAFRTPEIVSFRINPGNITSSHVVSQLEFSGPQAKFGINPDVVFDAYREAKNAGVSRFGVHMMPYSNVLDPRTFAAAARALVRIVLPHLNNLGITLDFIDVGGGFGIPYQDSVSDLDIDKTASLLREALQTGFEQYDMALPRLFVEPARYLVGNAGYLLGRVHAIKYGYQTIAGTDIGMNTFARTVLYHHSHRISIDARISSVSSTFAITGQICENTDLWEKSRALPADLSEGDIMVVHDVGAYGYAMSYQYNGRLRPAEVLIRGGEAKLIRSRESFDDMMRGVVFNAAAKRPESCAEEESGAT